MNKLIMVATPEKLIKMGFIEENDESGDPRGIDWNIRTDKFHLIVDAWREVKLSRINPDTDEIIIKCDDLYELQCIIDFIQD